MTCLTPLEYYFFYYKFLNVIEPLSKYSNYKVKRKYEHEAAF